jgi:hypothetical protein
MFISRKLTDRVTWLILQISILESYQVLVYCVNLLLAQGQCGMSYCR